MSINGWRLASAFVLTALVVAGPSYAARTWKAAPESNVPPGATPKEMAVQYAHIMDTRPDGTTVSVQWLAPPIQPESQSPLWRTTLDEYVMINVAHFSTTPGGSAVAIDGAPQLFGAEGALKPVAESEMPPDLAKFYAGVAPVKGSAAPRKPSPADAFLQSMRFYVYRGGGVHACAPGKLSVVFAGETYTYDTPFPGCPAK